MSDKKTIHIIAGGTISPVAPHLALAAPAYGKVGYQLARLCAEAMPDLDTVLHRTKMAGGNKLETNTDVAELIVKLKADYGVKIVFMPVALCDFEVTKIDRTGWDRMASMDTVNIGKDRDRLETSRGYHELTLRPADKIIPWVRNGKLDAEGRYPVRKDIFLVGFKTTSGATEDEQFWAGLNLLKSSSCNLVLANDLKTRVNMIITPEETRYHVTRDREEAMRQLVDMTKLRSHLTFTRSTVVAGDPVPWSSEQVPASLRRVVNYCIEKNAYKPFRGATVGHFAAKISDTEFLTSQRKTNFNDLHKIGLVRIKTDGPDTVIAYGAKPSVGGQSQRIVFAEHPGLDCIVHFHCPLKPCMGCHRKDWACGCNKSLGRKSIPIISQREYECGSHQCGQNTSRGLVEFKLPSGSIWVVMLDEHGPNIVFNHSIDPEDVIQFIETNFDLSAKTGGYVA